MKFNTRLVNITDEARLDVCAQGFWNPGQTAIFYKSVFNPNASRYGDTDIGKCYEMKEKTIQ